jgi:hypothetical protein
MSTPVYDAREAQARTAVAQRNQREAQSIQDEGALIVALETVFGLVAKAADAGKDKVEITSRLTPTLEQRLCRLLRERGFAAVGRPSGVRVSWKEKRKTKHRVMPEEAK